MEHKIFAIYDQKAHAYLPPFTLPRVEMAERTFMDCVNSKDHAFGLHPADYTLFELGKYDDEKGKISAHDIPQVIGTGVEYKALEPPLKYEGPTNENPLSHEHPVHSGSNGGN